MGRDRASRPEARPWRLFVAAEIPDEVRERLHLDLVQLRERVARARWVPPANWHVTLKFLGPVWPRLVEDVRRSVAEVAGSASGLVTRVTGAGAFPSERRARVIWAGLEDPKGGLAALAVALDGALAGIVKPEERGFSAHLTVARLREPENVAEALGGLGTVSSESFPVDRLVLYRSHLRRPAPVYEPVEAFPLEGEGSSPGR
jgi:2'-5' RNA ligase